MPDEPKTETRKFKPRNLLGVLLAKKSQIGPAGIKKYRNNGRDAAKMTRTRCTFERIGQALEEMTGAIAAAGVGPIGAAGNRSDLLAAPIEVASQGQAR